MTKHLPAAEPRKLTKVLGRLGSSHDGEVITAARMANAIVRKAGASWDEIIALSVPLIAPPSAPTSVAAKLSLCRRHLASLSAWEKQFVLDLRRFSHLSPKQLAVLDRLVAEISEGRCAA
jgi:hypothetical protein